MLDLGQDLLECLKKACGVEKIQRLLNHGADITVIDKDGNGVLHYAVENSLNHYPHNIALLIKCGADPLHQNAKGETPLFKAVQLDYDIVIQLLLKENISSIMIKDNLDRKPIDVAQCTKIKELLSSDTLPKFESYFEIQTELEELLKKNFNPNPEEPNDQLDAESLHLVGVIIFN